MFDFEMTNYHKLEYDFNPQTGSFEKSKIQADPRELKTRPFPLRFECPEMKIKSSPLGLSISGTKLNGKSTVFTPAFALKSTPGFYASKSLEALNGKEIAYILLFHPYLSKVDTKLIVYYFERFELNELVDWESLDKRTINEYAELFIANLKSIATLKEAAPGHFEFRCAVKVLDQYFKQYRKQLNT